MAVALLLMVFVVAVVVAVVISTSTSSTVVHYRSVIAKDAQSAISSVKNIINQYTK
jgi:hypothetical protein